MDNMNPFPTTNRQPSTSPKTTLGQTLPKKRPKKVEKQKSIRTSAALLIISLLALALYGFFYFIPRLQVYLKSPEELQEIQSKVDEYQEVVLVNLETERDLHKESYDSEFKRFNDALDDTFPSGVNKAQIVGTLERFAFAADAKFPPFKLTGINIGQTRQMEDYMVTDVAITIDNGTSLEAFDELLELIDASGQIDLESQEAVSEEQRLPLMSAETISVTYGEGQNAGQVNFSLGLQFYSRPDEMSNNS